MKTTYRLLLAAGLASLALTACNKQEEAKPAEEAAPAVVAAPTSDDKAAWQDYLKSVALRNMEGVNNAPYAYFLPGESSADFDSFSIERSSSVFTSPPSQRLFFSRPRKMLAGTSRLLASARSW